MIRNLIPKQNEVVESSLRINDPSTCQARHYTLHLLIVTTNVEKCESTFEVKQK